MEISIFNSTISISAASIAGKRPNNEDSLGWIALTKQGILGQSSKGDLIKNNKSVSNELLFCILCDGMGGLENGEIVSSLVVNKSLDWVQKRVFDEPNDIFIGYRNFLYDLEKQIISDYPGSGTTVVICFSFKNKWYSMHLGDSRCYSISKGVISRTRDHSPVEELFRSGIIDESDMNTHPMKNMISAFIGGNHTSKLAFEEMSKPERIILCSDGLCGHVDSDDFGHVLQNITDAEELINYALNTGSNDNISVILIDPPQGQQPDPQRPC